MLTCFRCSESSRSPRTALRIGGGDSRLQTDYVGTRRGQGEHRAPVHSLIVATADMKESAWKLNLQRKPYLLPPSKTLQTPSQLPHEPVHDVIRGKMGAR